MQNMMLAYSLQNTNARRPAEAYGSVFMPHLFFLGGRIKDNF